MIVMNNNVILIERLTYFFVGSLTLWCLFAVRGASTQWGVIVFAKPRLFYGKFLC